MQYQVRLVNLSLKQKLSKQFSNVQLHEQSFTLRAYLIQDLKISYGNNNNNREHQIFSLKSSILKKR